MWRVVLLLAGCNAVFGIKETRQYDAAYFDAPADAPFTCPALGGAAPMFSPSLHQDVIQDCSVYRERGGLVVGVCTDPTTFLLDNLSGSLHQPLTLQPGFPQPDYVNQQSYDGLRPASDGKHVYVRHGNTGTFTYEEWALGSDGVWAVSRIIPIGGYANVYDAFADRLLLADGAIVAYDEYTLDGTMTYQHTANELGLVGLISWDVSSDGLHAFVIGVAAGTNNRSAVYYTDRAALDTAFSPARRIANVPTIYELTVADDCSRLYFPALGSIFYVQQD